MLESTQFLPVTQPLDCYLRYPFCLLHSALKVEKKRPEEKKVETGCLMGADVEQGPRAAPGRWNFLNAGGKFSGKGPGSS